MRSLLILLFGCFFSIQLCSQEIRRPPVWGIAKMTYWVSSNELAKDFYGRLLGFDKAFSYQGKSGTIWSYKVNDRQFLEFVENKNAREMTRLLSYSLETEDVEQMRLYLQSKGVQVPASISLDMAGNEFFTVTDPSDITLEFIRFLPGSLHQKSKGKYLSANRISERIQHAGIYTKDVKENDRFYRDILGCKEIWKYQEPGSEDPRYVYLHFPDCIEFVEYSLSNPNVSHPCLLVTDMQSIIYTIKERGGTGSMSQPLIGKGNRWLLNLMNADQTRVEFTEAHTIK